MLVDISKLFQPAPGIKGYEDELSAIKSNRKAMSVFTGRRGDDYFEKIEKEALDLGLVLITVCQDVDVDSKTLEEVTLFVTNSDNIWRVQTYISFMKIANLYSPWTDRAEHFQSFLLGYSEEQIFEWIRYKHDVQSAWGACTVYFLATAAYLEKLNLLGCRCLHPDCDKGGITLFVPKRRLVLRTDAHQLVPTGMVISRLAISWRIANELLINSDNADKNGVAQCTLSPQSIPALNSDIRSSIEFFGESGWAKSPS